MPNMISVVNIVRSRLGKVRALSDAAVAVDTLETGHVEAAPPLHVLPGQLDRVTGGVPGHSEAADELNGALANVFHHAPVTRFVMQDCLVHPFGVEYNGGHLAKARSLLGRVTASPTEEVERAHYCMSGASARYFGHWLTDACPTALLAQDGGTAILDARPDWPDTPFYAQAFQLETATPTALRVRELHLYSDVSQGLSKRQRYETLKSRMRSWAGAGETTGQPVYLRRGATGISRVIAQEDTLCDALSRAGFTIVDLAQGSLRQRHQALSGAPVVVTVDGSHVCHAHYAMKPGSALITLIPADRFTMVHRAYAHAMGLRYGCVVLEPGDGGYRADLQEIRKTVDLLN